MQRWGKVSQNLYAEQLLRAAARQARGSGGMRVAAAHAKSVLADLGGEPEGMRIADGSGLSRLDLVRPRQLVDLLAGMHSHAHAALFRSTLPVAGVDGTLAQRMRGTPAEGVVRAKTGYIQSVVGLSGYVPRPDDPDRPLAFSILVNNFTTPADDVKGVVDAFVADLTRHAAH